MKKLKALLVEDSQMDEKLMLRQLAKADYEVQSIRVQTAADMKNALIEDTWDIVLSDYVMPGFTGIDALRVLRESRQDIPFIIISGTIGEDVAVEAMRAGVNDYLMKSNLTRLVPAIERELKNAANRRTQKQMREALRLSEASLANAQRIAHIGNWDNDLKNNHLRWSDEIYRIFGVSKADFDGTLESFFGFIHPEDRQMVQAAADAAIARLAPYNVEHRIICPDGKEKFVCETGEVTFDESGEPVHFIGTVQDITERKRNDQKLEQSIKRERAMIENSLDVICTIDAAGTFVSVSPASLEVWGYLPEELIGRPYTDLVAPEDAAKSNEEALLIMSGIETRDFENRYRHKNGSLVNVMWTVYWSGKDGLMYCVAHNITERKSAETKMRLMKSAIDSIVEGIVISDAQKPNNPIIYTNAAFENLTGYAFEEIKGQNCRFLQGEETNQRTVSEIREAIEQKTTFRGEILNYRKNGEAFWNELSISPVFDEAGILTNFVGTQQDVSERKQAEEILQASEAKFRQLVDSSIIGITITHLDGAVIEANDVFLKTVGYTRQDLLAGKLRWNDMTPPEILWQDERAKKQLYDFGFSTPREKEYIRKDGSRVPVMIGGTLLKDQENTVVAFVLDISDRKHAEDALRESENRLRTILDTEPECVKVLGLKGELLEMNPAGLAMIEADSLEQVRGSQVINIVAPEYRRAFARLTKNVLAGGTENLEFEIVGLKGTRCWMETHAVPMRNQAGEITSLLGVTRDITERKRAEAEKVTLAAQIEEHHERLSNIIDNITGVVWEAWGKPDEATQKIDFISDYVETMLGYTVEEWLAAPNFWLTIIHPDDRERMMQVTAENFLKSQNFTEEFRWIAKDGRTVWVETHSTVICDNAGQPIGYRGVNLDITERKRLEEERISLSAELASEKASLQHIFDNSPSFIVTMRGPKFIFEKANPAYYQLVGQRDLIGFPAIESLPEVMTQGLPEIINRVYTNGEPFIGNEVPLMLNSMDDNASKQHYINFVYMPLREADNSISGIISYGMDVTEQVQSRNKVQESVREQKELSAQLENERRRLLTAQSVAKVGSWETDLATMKVNWSAETYRIYEMEPDQYQPDYRAIQQFVHPDDREVIDEAFVDSLDTHGICKIVHRLLFADETVKFVEEHWEIIRDEHGKPVQAVGTCQDITERNRAEQLIIESEEKYRTIVETANEGIWLTDLEQRTTYVNRQMAEMLGYTIEEMQGRPIFDFVFDEDLPAAKSRFEQYSKGKSEIGEFRLRRKDGSEIITLYNTTPRKNQDGEVVGFLSMRSDITERKKAESELQYAEAKYRSLVESSPAIVYLAEPFPPFSPIYISPNVEVFGYTEEEWFNRPDMWVSLIHNDDREKILRATQNAIDREIETDLEYRIVKRDDTIAWIHDKGRFVLDEQGNKTGWQGVMVDITKTKELEEHLRQSQKLESVGLLAGGIAHDFNNMLTAINGYSDLTLRKMDEDNPLRQNIEEIKKAGERSADLTQQLLAFSRQQILQPIVLDLNETIKDTMKMLDRLIGEDIKLTTTLNPKIGLVKVDQGQFSQIILNLAVNSRDAMPWGGRLILETANVFLDPDYARQHAGVLPGAYVMMSVSDTGCGMSSEIKKHIFEPFFTTKEIGRGTGLGLATVYGIIKQSGGSIEVYSEEGVGTTFKIYLPRVAEQAARVENKVVSLELPEGTETILLVEDEEMVRHLARQILEECGYTVIEARNGLDALEIYEQSDYKFDLLITDVVMPEMGGSQLAEILRTKSTDLKILFTSGYTDDAVVRHGVIEDGSNFIQKPFTAEALTNKIREILNASQKT